jgi:hypothetical protein
VVAQVIAKEVCDVVAVPLPEFSIMTTPVAPPAKFVEGAVANSTLQSTGSE